MVSVMRTSAASLDAIGEIARKGTGAIYRCSKECDTPCQNGKGSLFKKFGRDFSKFDTTKNSGVWDEPSFSRKHQPDEHGNPWKRLLLEVEH